MYLSDICSLRYVLILYNIPFPENLWSSNWALPKVRGILDLREIKSNSSNSVAL